MSTQHTIPDIILERYLLGELDEQETQYIKALAAENRSVQKRIKEIQASDKDILLKYPAQEMAERIHKRYTLNTRAEQKKTKGFFSRPLPLAGLAAACAVLLAAVFIVSMLLTSAPGIIKPTDGSTRVKGTDMNYDKPLLALFLKKGEQGGEKLKEGSTVYAHDTVQVQYFAAKDKYGVIFSIDGRGKVSLHFPYRENASTVLTQHQKVFLDDSFELDDAPEFERFFFVTSDSPLNTNDILTQAEKMAKDLDSAEREYLNLPTTIHQTTFTLLKGEK